MRAEFLNNLLSIATLPEYILADVVAVPLRALV